MIKELFSVSDLGQHQLCAQSQSSLELEHFAMGLSCGILKTPKVEGVRAALGLCSSALSSSQGEKDFLVRNSLS